MRGVDAGRAGPSFDPDPKNEGLGAENGEEDVDCDSDSDERPADSEVEPVSPP